MSEFIKEYWLWILIPFLLVTLAVTGIWVMSGGENFSDFTYNVF